MKKIRLILFSSAMFFCGCTSLFFYPEKHLIYNPALERFSYNDVYFDTTDGIKLHGWHIRARGEQKGTILHFHGNAEQRFVACNVGLRYLYL